MKAENLKWYYSRCIVVASAIPIATLSTLRGLPVQKEIALMELSLHYQLHVANN